MIRPRAVYAALPAVVLLTAGVAWASGLTLTTTHLGAASVSTPVMYPVSITTANVGPNVGKVERNDTVTFVFSRPVNETTLCSGWTGQLATQTVAVTWVIQNGTGAGGDDVLVVGSVGATCAAGFHLGTVDLGAAGYVATNNVTFPNAATKLTLGASTTTVVVTMPTAQVGGGTVGTVASGAAALWTPDAAVTDTGGTSSGSNLAKSTSTVQF